MLRITGYFWQMCLLRAGPEAIPSSNFVLGFVLALYLPIAIFVSSFTRPSEVLTVTLVVVAIGVSMQGLVTYALTSFKGYRSRFKPTWSALLGTNAFMLLVLLPISLIIVNTDPQSTLKLFADSAWWVCFGWWLAIAGHIYHRAIDISVLQGSALVFLTEMMSVIITLSIVPSL